MASLLAANFFPKVLLCGGHNKEVSSWTPCNHVSFRRRSTNVSIHYRKPDQFRHEIASFFIDSEPVKLANAERSWVNDRSYVRLFALSSESEEVGVSTTPWGSISVAPSTTSVLQKLKVRKSTRVGSRKVGRNSNSPKDVPNRTRKDGRSKTRKDGRKIPTGIIHIQASLNNNIVTVTDARGQVFSSSSPRHCDEKTGKKQFQNTRRGTPFAAQVAAVEAISMAVNNHGLKRAKVMIKGPGPGRDVALRAIRRSDVQISVVRDVTPLPHNGCRPPKRRRL